MVDTEVKLNRLGLDQYTEMDNKKVIDVVGIGLKHLPLKRVRFKNGEYDYFNLPDYRRYECAFNVLRGIEVKVSRSDFRNGFICTSCNYNYVLTPMKLVSPSLIPKGVGLIEFNRYKFKVEVNNEKETTNDRPFRINGLRILKRPRYRHIPQFQIDHAIAKIAGKVCIEAQQDAYNQISDGMDNPELVYTIRERHS
jgi:hypothetical protein